MNRPRQAEPFRVPRRRLLLSLARSSVTVVLSVVVYYLLPLDKGLDLGTAIALAVSLVLFTGALAWQIRMIKRSDYPRLRAGETLATAGPTFLIIFAAAYVILSQNRSDSFSEVFGRTNALYFTVTVFATVGFGDIVPVTETARILTMIQMLADVVLVGMVARILLGAVRVAEEARAAGSGESPGAVGDE
ncbi:potassium channel family protein [Streptomyces sp. HM190]|uniref:potassium channel family protein n=1 Tax=Streptomyces sp. HM190 TaxID=2695266 RepID=UPI00135BA9EB|nr:potassium channel family protein [Streptomyces sp. HM190]